MGLSRSAMATVSTTLGSSFLLQPMTGHGSGAESAGPVCAGLKRTHAKEGFFFDRAIYEDPRLIAGEATRRAVVLKANPGLLANNRH